MDTKFYMAPLEGITGYVYRQVCAECFANCDKYFIPFIAPGPKKSMKTREKKDILPENNQGIYAVPQILTNHAEDFIGIADVLADYGYEEVNLNIGCPSGTVVSKGRGAGFLAEPEALNAFLEEVFSRVPIRISVKTRIGMENEEEFEKLLSIFNQYPIEELIIHPRLRKEFYKGKPHMEIFAKAVSESKNSLCYNGNLFTAADIREFQKQFPGVKRIMLGRGLIGNPALLEMVKEDSPMNEEKFRQFHEKIVSRYGEVLCGEKDVLFRMKELWFYMGHLFSEPEKYLKKIKKSNRLSEYEEVVERLLQEQKILPEAGFFFE